MYDLLIFLLALWMLPLLLYRAIFQGKHLSSFLKKLGIGFPKIHKRGRRLIWVHAVSLGETKAVASLCRLLQGQPDHPLLIFTTITETGLEEAKKILPEADYHLYLPFDLRLIIVPIVKRIAPDLLILSETDFWFNFLNAAQKSGAKVVLVNGKISERSMKRFAWLPSFTKRLFNSIDLFCLQSPQYRNRFTSLGIAPEKLVITGNLKFDDAPVLLTEAGKEALRKSWKIADEDSVLVIGSSHDPEESLLLDVLHRVWPRFPRLRVVLAPRHPQRFDAVAKLLSALGISFWRYSQGICNLKEAPSVILVDSMGLLRNCFQIAHIAIVAGSYTNEVGGHNILEPLWFGVPTLYGPYMHSQPELVELVNTQQAGLQVPIEELEESLAALLESPHEASKLRQRSLQLMNSMRGSTQRTREEISHRLGF